jgi:hypothetical protein
VVITGSSFLLDGSFSLLVLLDSQFLRDSMAAQRYLETQSPSEVRTHLRSQLRQSLSPSALLNGIGAALYRGEPTCYELEQSLCLFSLLQKPTVLIKHLINRVEASH